MSDKLFIDLWGATVSADGLFAIVAAVIIVLILVRQRGSRSRSRPRDPERHAPGIWQSFRRPIVVHCGYDPGSFVDAINGTAADFEARAAFESDVLAVPLEAH